MNLSNHRETERMFHEECITRQVSRRRQEREVRRKEELNRSIEDHRRAKEEARVCKEKYQYLIYELYKQGDHHKHLLYYREPYTLDLELLLRIEEEERVEKENRRRAKENIRWAWRTRGREKKTETTVYIEEDSPFKNWGFICVSLKSYRCLIATHESITSFYRITKKRSYVK